MNVNEDSRNSMSDIDIMAIVITDGKLDSIIIFASELSHEFFHQFLFSFSNKFFISNEKAALYIYSDIHSPRCFFLVMYIITLILNSKKSDIL